jgi:hypothetical protein
MQHVEWPNVGCCDAAALVNVRGVLATKLLQASHRASRSEQHLLDGTPRKAAPKATATLNAMYSFIVFVLSDRWLFVLSLSHSPKA